MSLDDLGAKYGTDKGLRHDYLKIYETYLNSIHFDPITLLELGVLDGASLRMWREWMPQATIVGLDQKPPISIDGCVVLQGQQDDPAAIAKVAEHSPFDVIIDDASHLSSKTISSFELLWPHLAPGGLYVVEDLHSSYWQAIYGDKEANRDPDNYLAATAMNYLKRLADEVNFDPTQDLPDKGPRWAIYPRRYWRGYHLESVQFTYGCAWITKHPDADYCG